MQPQMQMQQPQPQQPQRAPVPAQAQAPGGLARMFAHGAMQRQQQAAQAHAEVVRRTGLTWDYARLSLDAAGGDVERAVVLFQERKHQLPADAFQVTPARQQPQQPQQQQPQQQQLQQQQPPVPIVNAAEADADDFGDFAVPSAQAAPTPQVPAAVPSTNFATFPQATPAHDQVPYGATPAQTLQAPPPPPQQAAQPVAPQPAAPALPDDDFGDFAEAASAPKEATGPKGGYAKGARVWYRCREGLLVAKVVGVDRTMDPPGYTVVVEGTGAERHTEESRLSVYTETAAPSVPSALPAVPVAVPSQAVPPLPPIASPPREPVAGFADFSQPAQPAAAPQAPQAPKPVVCAAADDDFGDFAAAVNVVPPLPPIASPARESATDDFGDFSQPVCAKPDTAAAPSAEVDDFGDFAAPSPAEVPSVMPPLPSIDSPVRAPAEVQVDLSAQQPSAARVVASLADDDFADFATSQPPSAAAPPVMSAADNFEAAFAGVSRPPAPPAEVSKGSQGAAKAVAAADVDDDDFADFAAASTPTHVEIAPSPAEVANAMPPLPPIDSPLREPEGHFASDAPTAQEADVPDYDFGDFAAPNEVDMPAAAPSPAEPTDAGCASVPCEAADDFGDFAAPSNVVPPLPSIDSPVRESATDDFGDFSQPVCAKPDTAAAPSAEVDDFGDFAAPSQETAPSPAEVSNGSHDAAKAVAADVDDFADFAAASTPSHVEVTPSPAEVSSAVPPLPSIDSPARAQTAPQPAAAVRTAERGRVRRASGLPATFAELAEAGPRKCVEASMLLAAADNDGSQEKGLLLEEPTLNAGGVFDPALLAEAVDGVDAAAREALAQTGAEFRRKIVEAARRGDAEEAASENNRCMAWTLTEGERLVRLLPTRYGLVSGKTHALARHIAG